MPCARELKGRVLWIIVVDDQRAVNVFDDAPVDVLNNANRKPARSSLRVGFHAGKWRRIESWILT